MRGREERRGGRRGLIEGDLLSLVVLLQELNPVSEKRRKDRKKWIKFKFICFNISNPTSTGSLLQNTAFQSLMKFSIAIYTNAHSQ